ncbi:SAM-dependent methyltransferase [Actinoplanes sp. NPDC051861]|uniref:SAM-dependent methyltransferase n=1 Tax=Actinoplanes sp. NPDC051861 TaxID=3155170 RepID=UPI00341F84C5
MTGQFDSNVPASARVYDYLLGGKDNFFADRALGGALANLLPSLTSAYRANREFIKRAVRELTTAGVDQLMDVGVGFPCAENVHEIAHQINPRCKVIYADNDPLVLTHARALMAGPHEAAAVEVVDADLRKPADLLQQVTRAGFDLERPVGLLLHAVLHDIDDPHHLVAELLAPLARGSWLSVTHLGIDLLPPSVADGLASLSGAAGLPLFPRSRDEIGCFFTGLDLIDPGIVAITRWRPDRSEFFGLQNLSDSEVGIYGAAARKP